MSDGHIHFFADFDDGRRDVVQPITTSMRIANAWLVFGPSMAGVVACVAIFGTPGYVGAILAMLTGLWAYWRPQYAVIKGVKR